MERAVENILAFEPSPDTVLAEGDLADLGAQREYEALRALLARLDMPVYMIPDNYDNREHMIEISATFMHICRAMVAS
ncbi:MAG: hypothetical protein VX416_07220 [Pseudomonadota bacterium]|nr:hypothetical protein [Pseudomonadota bacterium]